MSDAEIPAESDPPAATAAGDSDPQLSEPEAVDPSEPVSASEPVRPPEPAGEPEPASHGPVRRWGQTALFVGALGVVFGDIGTSPLYAMQTVFTIDNGAVRPTTADVYGVVSMMFWSVTIVVSIKYIGVVMRADNDGEGGVMALIALVRRLLGEVRASTKVIVALGILGASLFYGDP